ncbi:MAG: T9SS type A sorting domain-containing protein [Bacteroidia bacterium]|nr:T9SS type A sorting domain-containing protein [Bacteroidia bacterium]
MKKHLLFSALMVLTISICYGQDFTAVQNGNWSSNSTWGGLGPGNNVNGLKDVIIPAGITVTLDIDVEVNTNRKIQIDGVLDGPDHGITLSGGNLEGTGTILLDILDCGLSSNISLGPGGDLTANSLSNQANILNFTEGNHHILGVLILTAGVIRLTDNALLSLTDTTWLEMCGGRIRNQTVNDITTNLNVRLSLNADSLANDLSLGEAVFGDIQLNFIDPNHEIILGEDIIVNGSLDLESGILDLAGNDIEINGNFTTNQGRFKGNASSGITANGGGSFDAFDFLPSFNFLSELNINRDTLFSVTLAGPLQIFDTLSLLEGELELPGDTLAISGFIHSHQGMFTGNPLSTILIQGLDSGGVFSFKPGRDTINNLIINRESSGLKQNLPTGKVGLISNLTINNNLLINSGMLFVVNTGQYGKAAPSSKTVTVKGTAELNGMVGIATTGPVKTLLDTVNIILNGDFITTALGKFVGSEQLNLLIANTGLLDTFSFAAGYDTLGIFSLARENGMLTLGSNLAIDSLLTLANGYINLNVYDLFLDSHTEVAGFWQGSYIITSDTGSLIRNIQSLGEEFVFPVGTLASYAPGALTLENGSGLGDFGLRVFDGVFQDGYSGALLSDSLAVVDLTWDFSTDAIAPLANIMLEWFPEDEVNGFDTSQCYISHYSDSTWDVQDSLPATPTDSGSYFTTRSMSAPSGSFVITSETLEMHISENTVPVKSDIFIYPNPSGNTLNISIASEAKMDIIDITGKLASTYQLNNQTKTLNLSNLSNGEYLCRISYTGSGKTDTFKLLITK